MRWKPFRITELWAKLTYVLVGWLLIPTAIRFLLERVGVPEPVITALDLAGGLAMVWFGTRVFRARGEDIEPQRVWWRATGRPPAGYVLFALFALGASDLVVPPVEAADPSWWWYSVMALPIAAFYLHSSIRLVRGDAPVPPRRRRDDDLRLIDRKRRF